MSELLREGESIGRRALNSLTLLSLTLMSLVQAPALAQDRRVSIHRLSTANGISQDAVDTAKKLATAIAIIEGSRLPNGEVLVNNSSLSTGFLFSSRCHALVPLHGITRKKEVTGTGGRKIMRADDRLDIKGATVDLTFGYNTPSSSKTRISGKVLVFGDMTFDYAIIRLNQRAPDHIKIVRTAFGTLEEMKDAPSMTIGTPGDIYNYNDPNTPFIVDPTCRTTRDAGPYFNSTCLGFGGSSGSPVLTRVAKDDKTGREMWAVTGMVVAGGKPSQEVLAQLSPAEKPTGQAEFMSYLGFNELEYRTIWQDIKRDLDKNPCN